jgi:hypothetical protein
MKRQTRPHSPSHGTKRHAPEHQPPHIIALIPFEVIYAIIDRLDIISAMRLFATCKSFWFPSDRDLSSVRKQHKELVQTLRYNTHSCLLATREVIQRNAHHGLRELDAIVGPKDADLRRRVASRSVSSIRSELSAQSNAISLRLLKYDLAIASICTLGLP